MLLRPAGKMAVDRDKYEKSHIVNVMAHAGDIAAWAKVG